MQKTKIILLIGLVVLLSGCSKVQINQTPILSGETIIGTNTITGDTITTATDISVTVLQTTGDDTASVTDTTSQQIDNSDTPTTQTTAEDNALKEKIRKLIEQRKSQSSGLNKLTEDDITLMENILKEILDQTSQK